MKRTVIRRDEMLGATLKLGGTPIALDEYATTGLLALAVGPRGNGKTNAGLLMAEQLSSQGWVSVLIDPENELESLYGDAVPDPDALQTSLARRDKPILVVNARDGRSTGRGLGWEYLHVAIDDRSRLAFTQRLPSERQQDATAFLDSSLAWFKQHGITVQRVMTDNGSA